MGEGIDEYPFQPAAHDGIPVAVPGTRRKSRYGRHGRHPHPPLACPDPRLMATFRGFYRCPACGEKVQLAGQLKTAEVAYELADRWIEALIEGVVMAAWVAWESAKAAGRGVLWLRRRARRRGSEPEIAGRMAPEMVRALVMMSMVAARNGGQDRHGT